MDELTQLALLVFGIIGVGLYLFMIIVGAIVRARKIIREQEAQEQQQGGK
jgi:hypothetical protein